MQALDAYLPVYEFSERHRIAIRADSARIDRALRAVTFREIPLVRLLLAARGLGRRRGPESALETLARSGVILVDEPGRGVVLGLTGQFWRRTGGDRSTRCRTPAEFAAFDRADTCQAVVDFRVGDGTLSTETRVHVRGARAYTRFRRYWRVVRPFSGLTRIVLLRAVKRRAERRGTG